MRFLATLRSETLKFRTVRANLLGVALTFVFTIGLGALVCVAVRSNWQQLSTTDRLSFDPVRISLGGTLFAQFAVGVIGARFITSEYASGMIRTTLTATPQRLRVALAKAAVLKIALLVVCEISVVAAFFAGQAILRGVTPTSTFTSPGVARAVLLTGVYLMLSALIGYGLGLIIRQSAGAISAFTSLFLIIPILVFLLPASWQTHISKYEPANLGESMRASVAVPGLFGPWTALAILCAYTAAVVGVGLVLFHTRDA
mgnify:CR=1 FL=1